MKHAFLTYCPNVNGTTCGLKTHNLTIEASKDVQTFNYTDLRYATNKWKNAE
jgi:hypothetical protein